MKNINVSIIGAGGLSGLELIKILSKHPNATLKHITSGKYKDQALKDVFATFSTSELIFEAHDCDLTDTELVFLAIPNNASLETVPNLLAKGLKIIDLSAKDSASISFSCTSLENDINALIIPPDN